MVVPYFARFLKLTFTILKKSGKRRKDRKARGGVGKERVKEGMIKPPKFSTAHV